MKITEKKLVIGKLEEPEMVIKLDNMNYAQISSYVIPTNEHQKRDLVNIIINLYEIMSGSSKNAKNILLRGQYGSGKSHLLSFLFFIFNKIDLGGNYHLVREKILDKINNRLEIETNILEDLKNGKNKYLIIPINLRSHYNYGLVYIILDRLLEILKENNFTKNDKYEQLERYITKYRKEGLSLDEKDDLYLSNTKNMLVFIMDLAKSYGFTGSMILFDEFSAYYKGLNDMNKSRATSVLQSVAEKGIEFNISTIFSMQEDKIKEMLDADQIKRRFIQINLSTIDPRDLILMRLLPHREKDKITAIYNKDSKFKMIKQSKFVNYYPFNHMVIDILGKLTDNHLADASSNILTYSSKMINNWMNDSSPIISINHLYNSLNEINSSHHDRFGEEFKIEKIFVENLHKILDMDSKDDKMLLSFVSGVLLQKNLGISIEEIKSLLLIDKNLTEIKEMIASWIDNKISKLHQGQIIVNEIGNNTHYSFKAFLNETVDVKKYLAKIKPIITEEFIKKGIWMLRLFNEDNKSHRVDLDWFAEKLSLIIYSNHKLINNFRKSKKKSNYTDEFHIKVIFDGEENQKIMKLDDSNQFLIKVKSKINLDKHIKLIDYFAIAILEAILNENTISIVYNLAMETDKDLFSKINKEILKNYKQKDRKKILLDLEERILRLKTGANRELKKLIDKSTIHFRGTKRKVNTSIGYWDGVSESIYEILSEYFHKNPKISKNLTTDNLKMQFNLIMKDIENPSSGDNRNIKLTSIPLGLVSEAKYYDNNKLVKIQPQSDNLIANTILSQIKEEYISFKELFDYFWSPPYRIDNKFILLIILAMLKQNMILIKAKDDNNDWEEYEINEFDIKDFGKIDELENFYIFKEDIISDEEWKFYKKNAIIFRLQNNKMQGSIDKTKEIELSNHINNLIRENYRYLEILLDRFVKPLKKISDKNGFDFPELDEIQIVKLYNIINSKGSKKLAQIMAIIEDNIDEFQNELSVFEYVVEPNFRTWRDKFDELNIGISNEFIPKIDNGIKLDYEDLSSYFSELYDYIQLDGEFSKKINRFVKKTRDGFIKRHYNYNKHIDISIKSDWINAYKETFGNILPKGDYYQLKNIVDQIDKFNNSEICELKLTSDNNHFYQNYECTQCDFNLSKHNSLLSELNKVYNKFANIFMIYNNKYCPENVLNKNNTISVYHLNKLKENMNTDRGKVIFKEKDALKIFGLPKNSFLRLSEIEKIIDNLKSEHPDEEVLINFSSLIH